MHVLRLVTIVGSVNELPTKCEQYSNKLRLPVMYIHYYKYTFKTMAVCTWPRLHSNVFIGRGCTVKHCANHVRASTGILLWKSPSSTLKAYRHVIKKSLQHSKSVQACNKVSSFMSTNFYPSQQIISNDNTWENIILLVHTY